MQNPRDIVKRSWKIAACLDFEAFYLRFRDGRGIIDTLLGFSGLDKQRKLVEIVYNEYKRKVKEQLKLLYHM